MMRHRRIPNPLLPPRTRLAKDLPLPRADPNRVFTLDKLQREALAGVPRDVAVQEPGARVVQAERDGEVAVGGQDGRVAPGRVGRVEGVGASVPGSALLRQEPEVVAVQVDGVRDAGGRAGLSVCNEGIKY